MKSLIFSGLVLGSVAYLIATQTDVLQNWKPQELHVAKDKAIQLDQDLRPIHQQAAAIQDSQLVRELQATVTSLKSELAQLSLALKEAKEPKIDTPEASPPMSVNHEQSQLVEPLQRRQIEPDNVSVSPYMPAAERSNALMEIVHRMEMKAAGY